MDVVLPRSCAPPHLDSKLLPFNFLGRLASMRAKIGDLPPDARECAICLEPFNGKSEVLEKIAIKRECGHVFMQQCLLEWLSI